MIDTHTHLYLEEFDADRSDAVMRAVDSGVSHMILPNVDLTTIDAMHSLHSEFPQHTSMAMGFHPTEVDADYKTSLDVVYRHFAERKYVAVGEIGIDLYWDATYRSEQMKALDVQFHWAVEMGLPVIIHCREGISTVFEVMDSFRGELPKGVFHSFTGTVDDVAEIRRRGDFYFGINGIVTFKKSTIPQLLPAIGIDRLLLETDSPYLAPVPNRGRRNESANIPHINACIAQHLMMTPEQVSAKTDANAKCLFGI